MAQLSTLTITWTATNNGREPVDVTRYPLEFTVDGVSSMNLNMAFGNGGFADDRQNLPPGATVHDERLGLEHVFEHPGAYVIVLSIDGHEVARATLHVTQ